MGTLPQSTDQHDKLPLPFKCSLDAEPMLPLATRTLESTQDPLRHLDFEEQVNSKMYFRRSTAKPNLLITTTFWQKLGNQTPKKHV